MKKLLLLVPFAFFAIGCNTGDTPIQTYPTSKPQAAAPKSPPSDIQSNPNIPDEAKKAILNQNRPGAR